MAKKRKRKSNLSNKFKTKVRRKTRKKKLGQLRTQKNKPRIDPLWTLEDGVTYSLLSRFLVCRHRFHIAKVQGWRPKHFNLPLEFGNIFHHMEEAKDMGIDRELLPKIATNYVNQKIETGNFHADVIRELTMLAGVTSVTFMYYHDFWDRNASMDYQKQFWYENKFDWVAKEQAFDVNYTMSNGRKIRLRGKKDGVFQLNRKTPGRWVFETKTKGRIDEHYINEGLHKDMQTGMYMVADELETGHQPVGCLYNVIRRTQLKPRVKESAKDFVSRVEADIQKRPDFYFMRWHREINRQELEDFKRRQLDPALFQLVTWWDSIKRNPMNPFESIEDCVNCGGTRRMGAGSKGIVKCDECKDGTHTIPNLHHYERAFGQYDGMSMGNNRGDFFEIVTNDNYNNYEQSEYCFPELEVVDDVDQYLEGVK